MGVTVIQMFPPTQLSSSPVTLYSVAIGTIGTVLRGARIRFVNTGTTAYTVSAFDPASAIAGSAANDFFPAQTINAGSYVDTDIPVISGGGTIQASSPGGTLVVAHALDGAIFTP